MSWLQEPFDLVTNFFIVFVYCSLDFRAKFELIVTRLCNNFLEDMRPQRAGHVIAWKAKVRTLL